MDEALIKHYTTALEKDGAKDIKVYIDSVGTINLNYIVKLSLDNFTSVRVISSKNIHDPSLNSIKLQF